MKFAAAVFIGLLSLAAGAAGAQPLSVEDRAHIADIETKLPSRSADGQAGFKTLAARMAETKVPAVSIAFIQDGRIRWAKAYGLADVASGRPATQDTLFQAASMSKALTAAAVLRLAEQGKLDLDQDVNARLTGWKVPASPFTEVDKVTLRRILSHTAGLSQHGFPGYAPGKPVPTTVQILNGQPPANTQAVVSDARPGERYSYSGGGYVVAQLLMTQVAGQPFPKLMDRLVLKPAGMRRSTFEQPLPEMLRPQAATAYLSSGLPTPGGYNTYPEYAPAGLWTTPSDYARFVIALQDAYGGRPGGILTAASVKTMATPTLNRSGLGVQVGSRAGRPTIQHGGSNQGFQSDFYAFLDGSRQGVVIMTNGDNGGILAGELLRAVIDTYDFGKPDPQR